MSDVPLDMLNGISGALAKEGDVRQMILVAFIGLSCYNVAELIVLVPATFRRWRGLYFWALLVSGVLGVVPYSVGFLMKFFTHTLIYTYPPNSSTHIQLHLLLILYSLYS